MSNAERLNSPWFCDGFLHALASCGIDIKQAQHAERTISGAVTRNRYGLRLLQVGSHYGAGIAGSGDILRSLRSSLDGQIDAVKIISPIELEELANYSVENKTGTVLLPLEGDEDSLWSNVRKSFRGCINQGRRKGNTITWNEGRDYEDIRRIYSAHVAEKQFSALDWLVIDKLYACSGQGYQLDLGLVRDPDGRAAAMAGILMCGNTAIYLVGGSRPESLHFYPGHFLQWHAITRYRRLGFGRYDFGGATEDVTKRTHAITMFKRGFGGKYVRFFCYEIPLSSRFRLYQMGRWLLKRRIRKDEARGEEV